MSVRQTPDKVLIPEIEREIQLRIPDAQVQGAWNLLAVWNALREHPEVAEQVAALRRIVSKQAGGAPVQVGELIPGMDAGDLPLALYIRIAADIHRFEELKLAVRMAWAEERGDQRQLVFPLILRRVEDV